MAPSNPLLNPGASLSGPALLQAAKALVNAQVGGPLSELAHQIAQNTRRGQGAQKLTAGYFGQLGQQAQQGYQDVTQAGSDLNSQLQGIGQRTASALQGIGNDAQANLARYSPGMSGGPGAQSLAAAIAAQQGRSAQNQGAFQSFGATQGANQRGLAGSNLGTFALQGQERIGQIGQAAQLANEPLNAKIAGLRETEGALLTKNLGALRQQEINNRITEQGLGIKASALNAQVKNQNAQNKLAQERIDATIRGQNVSLTLGQARNRIASINSQIAAGRLSETQRHNLVSERTAIQRGLNAKNKTAGGLPKTTPTGSPTLSVAEQSKLFQSLDKLPGIIKRMQQPLDAAQAKALGMPVGAKLSESQIRGLLGQKYDPALVDSGYALHGYGYLTPTQITELNRLGLIVGSRYKRGQVTAGGQAKHGIDVAVGGVKGILGL